MLREQTFLGDMLGKFKFIFHICAMKETLDFFIVKV